MLNTRFPGNKEKADPAGLLTRMRACGFSELRYSARPGEEF